MLQSIFNFYVFFFWTCLLFNLAEYFYLLWFTRDNDYSAGTYVVCTVIFVIIFIICSLLPVFNVCLAISIFISFFNRDELQSNLDEITQTLDIINKL